MKCKKCDLCGANLDFGEKCDCKKENGLPHANENSPKEDADTSNPDNSIPHKSKIIKTNPLRDLRISKKIPAKEIIELVRAKYPKYDKTLQSKCERGEEYGVELRKDAMDALYEAYAPEELEKLKKKRRGGHRLTCRITCRLEDDEYNRLVACIKEDGFDQMQAWLTYIVRNYLKAKSQKGNP